MKIRLVAALVAGAMLCASHVFAADGYTIRDGMGNMRPMGAKSDGQFTYPWHLCAVWVAGQLVPCNGDGSGNLGVNIISSALPGNAAQEAGGHLASVDTKTPALNGDGGVPTHVTNWPTSQAVQTSGYATTDGSTTQTTGGTAQALFGGATPAHGFKLAAPSAAAGSFVCWISDTTTTPSATTAGSYPLYAQGQYSSEAGQLPAGPVYVNCPSTGQPISAQRW